ncbi:hypothetical protein Zmor_024361 [Zophobas morio]|uniref:PHD-type domain-containing protein n=1 Tax=Zophobas morio TaxID=2755281 RepID=A0AA38I093_9CUCU|nr:hypothetical protein Zmor_024361 [Zophobas morio]
MAIKCRKCNKTIGRAEDYISCRKECAANYHLPCVNLTKSAVTSLKDTGSILTWGCGFRSPLSLNNSADPLLDSGALQKLPDFLKEVFAEFSRTVNENFKKLNEQVAGLKHENSLRREEISRVLQQHLDCNLQISKNNNNNLAISYATTLKNTSAVVIKPKNTTQTTMQTKSDIVTSFNLENTDKLGIAKVKSIKNGGVLLQCHDPGEFKRLVQNNKLEEKYDIHDVKTPLPRIRISGISDGINEEMIVPLLLKQNKHIFSVSSQCVLVKLLPVKNHPKIFQVILQVDVTSYRNALSLGHCLIGLDGCNIYDAVDVIRCYRCNGYNHSVKTCKKSISCPRCSEAHVLQDCQATSEQLKCVNCTSIKSKDNLSIEETSHACWDYGHCVFYKNLIKKVKSDLFGISDL